MTNVLDIEATETFTVGTESVAIRLPSEATGDALFGFDVQMPPGGGPPMLHHHDPFEMYRVLDGELTFYLGDEAGVVRRSVAKAGSVVAIPAGREHTIRNESGADARAFVVFSPGKPMEGFLRGAHALSAEGPPRPEQIIALAEEHGIRMTRPIPPSA